MTRAVIADDERLMRDQLKARLAEVWPELQIVGEAKNGLEAVDLVAEHGHRLLREYGFDPRSGHWRHRDPPAGAEPELTDLLSGPAPAPPQVGEEALAGQLEQARAVLQSRPDELTDRPSGLPPELEALREFHLPPDCLR